MLGRCHSAALTVELENSVLHTVLGKIDETLREQPACKDKKRWIDFLIKEAYLTLQELFVRFLISSSVVHAKIVVVWHALSNYFANLAFSIQIETLFE